MLSALVGLLGQLLAAFLVNKDNLAALVADGNIHQLLGIGVELRVNIVDLRILETLDGLHLLLAALAALIVAAVGLAAAQRCTPCTCPWSLRL